MSRAEFTSPKFGACWCCVCPLPGQRAFLLSLSLVIARSRLFGVNMIGNIISGQQPV